MLPFVVLGYELGLDVGGHHTDILNGFLEFSGRAAPVRAPLSEFVGIVDVDAIEVRLVRLVVDQRRCTTDKRGRVAGRKRVLERFIDPALAALYGFLVSFFHQE